MAKWRVTFELELQTESHPDKWLPSTIDNCIEADEKSENWQFEYLSDQIGEKENVDE